jgi:hypothetical protein
VTDGETSQLENTMQDVIEEVPTEALPVVVEKISAGQTPAQAKTDAIAALTMKVYERASTLQLTEEECARLQADFPDEAFRPGAAGKQNLIYIEHAFLRDRLNEVFGPGQWALIPRQRWSEDFSYFKDNGEEIVGKKVYVEAMLCVRGAFVAEAVGDMDYYPKNLSTNYGDAVEGAKTAALRRCAKELGIGLQAWKKGWCEGWWARKGTQTAASGNENGPSDHAPQYGPKPPCPKCGKKDSVIIGKAEYGGGYVCFKKKQGCGHKWDGKDPRTGEDAAPEKDHGGSILDDWKKKLDPDRINLDVLNGEIMTDYRLISGKHPERTKVWSMILAAVKPFGIIYKHGGPFIKQA